MKTIFKKGDRVYDYRYKWGVILEIRKHWYDKSSL